MHLGSIKNEQTLHYCKLPSIYLPADSASNEIQQCYIYIQNYLHISSLLFLKNKNRSYTFENFKITLCLVMQEASDAHSKTADSDTVSTYQVSSVQLVTDKLLVGHQLH